MDQYTTAGHNVDTEDPGWYKGAPTELICIYILAPIGEIPSDERHFLKGKPHTLPGMSLKRYDHMLAGVLVTPVPDLGRLVIQSLGLLGLTASPKLVRGYIPIRGSKSADVTGYSCGRCRVVFSLWPSRALTRSADHGDHGKRF